MPHVVYLHSALTQNRIPPRDDDERRALLRFQRVDVMIAMGIAGLINLSMLIVAASLFHAAGLTGVDSIEGAHAGSARCRRRRRAGLRGRAAGLRPVELERRHLRRPGRDAGLHRAAIPLFLRRASRWRPRWSCSRSGVDPTSTLVITQVVLSFGIPFALVPLVLLTRRRDVMGALVNRRSTTAVASIVAALIIALNGFLLYETFFG